LKNYEDKHELKQKGSFSENDRAPAPSEQQYPSNNKSENSPVKDLAGRKEEILNFLENDDIYQDEIIIEDNELNSFKAEDCSDCYNEVNS
jgi:hypothetical protein